MGVICGLEECSHAGRRSRGEDDSTPVGSRIILARADGMDRDTYDYIGYAP